MRRKNLSLLMVLMMLVTTLSVSACAVDTVRLAGSAAGISQSAEQTEVTDEAVPDAEPADREPSAEIRYDSSDFLASVSPWNRQPYCEINANVPDIDEIWTVTQESLDPLDALGRCGTANSCIGLDGMPSEPRGNISEIHPTGWHTDKYEGVEGGNLYNRCHLIAHKLSGDDAVARNLITGTSYMNRQGMLPFEDRIEEYVKSTGNHVMYRVTPCFAGDELVARGVHMQAVSVEDQGKGLSFNVYCYNVQPGIEIDYATGDNRLEGSDALPAGEQAEEASGAVSGETQNNSGTSETATYVLNTNTGKFHYPDCSSVRQMKDKNKRVTDASRDEVIAQGYEPCGNCRP